MSETAHSAGTGGDTSRRDMLLYASVALGTVGTALAVWPFLDSMNPAKDVLALASIEVDLSPIQEGQAITAVWRGKPVFIRHRTPADIEQSRAVEVSSLRDPQADEDRVIKDQWLVMIGICTHLGCVPKGQKPGDPKGDYNGWFCVCHGSHYDTAGRIRKGPAPLNLPVPPYDFLDETSIRIG
ncbi:ubiquinol-cytochrome c reductase iron-sulfur subunit [Roseospira visakhapatnamensis]|uniref:Ubiquinol-cytochrome c reductase iron-sulfur subunit n=1 Tax=Roseospira visakhapatnamensis TaxID=390880 RepID=A0A7W6RB29_9PROT|nr:ubiquinol-cytochrome c reductase iron-sulfur subunit [Roseospira visakhapatnamensis]MBB4264644.1 ubiquinol-cytochrome c reductase iron-sulfur subunit [Roseospira visakhapatnamensis]